MGVPNTLEKIYRIFDAIEPDEYGCKNWPKGHFGYYARVHICGVAIYAHRLSLERKLGRPIKPGYQAQHTCDNRSCINPEHLKEGTDQDNIQDRQQRYPESFNHLRDPKNRELFREAARRGGKTLRERFQNDPEFRAQQSELKSQNTSLHWDKVRAEAEERRRWVEAAQKGLT